MEGREAAMMPMGGCGNVPMGMPMGGAMPMGAMQQPMAPMGGMQQPMPGMQQPMPGVQMGGMPTMAGGCGNMPMAGMQMGGMQMGGMMGGAMFIPCTPMPLSQMQNMATAAGGDGAAGGGVAINAPKANLQKVANAQKQERKKEKDNVNVVFVGGLRKTTEEDRVTAHFAKFGQVEHVDIKRLPDGTSRGFAFVKFIDAESIERVIDAHAKHMIDNKWVEVRRRDSMAAHAGRNQAAKEKEKEPEEEAPAENADFEESWSQQYLQMAQQMASQSTPGETPSQGTQPAAGMQSQMPGMQGQMAMPMMGMMPGGMMMMPVNPAMMGGMGMGMMPMNGMMGGGGMMMMPMGAMPDPQQQQQPMDQQQQMIQPAQPGQMAEQPPPLPEQPAPPHPIANEPANEEERARSRSASVSTSRSRSESRGSDRSRSESPAAPPPAVEPLQAQALAQPQFLFGNLGMLNAGATQPMGMASIPPPPSMASFPQTSPMSMSEMLQQSATAQETEQKAAPQPFITQFAPVAEDPKASVDSGAAAQVADFATRAAQAARDAARDYAKSAEATASTVSFQMQKPRASSNVDISGDNGMDPSRNRLPDDGRMKHQVKLWLPEQTVAAAPPPPPPPAMQQDNSQKKKSRSRSKGKRSSPTRKSRRGGGWDKEETGAIQAASQIPSRPAAPPGMTPAPAGPNVHAPLNKRGIPEATPEALHAAVLRAAQVEAAGRDAIRRTGQIPRGPPDLPTATEVIEQKCVAYLIGRNGQALAGINAAAGASIQIDQSTKMYGWSMANIYATEEGATKAKMILRQKIAEYRPLRS